VSQYFNRLKCLVDANLLAIQDGVSELARTIFEVSSNDGRIWVMGNGGSASTAEHFEIDMLFVRDSNLEFMFWPTVSSLTSNSAVITAIGNDIGFDYLFEQIIEKKCKKGDLVIVISASGNSENLVNAVRKAQTMGVKTFGLLGFNGGVLKACCDKTVIVLSDIGEYGPVEDIHLSICHAVAHDLRMRLQQKNISEIKW
jgi:D-sedoheptulose 7-phosphate isomerase